MCYPEILANCRFFSFKKRFKINKFGDPLKKIIFDIVMIRTTYGRNNLVDFNVIQNALEFPECTPLRHNIFFFITVCSFVMSRLAILELGKTNVVFCQDLELGFYFLLPFPNKK